MHLIKYHNPPETCAIGTSKSAPRFKFLLRAVCEINLSILYRPVKGFTQHLLGHLC